MRSILRTLIVTMSTGLALVGPGAHTAAAQPINGVIGSYYPKQLNPGQTNILHVAVGPNNPIQSLEITPSAGITVTGMTFENKSQGTVWWEFTIAVAKDAAPGPRMLVAVQQTGRTAPVTVTIPNHVPNISNLRIVSAQTKQPNVDLQFAASNQGGTFGTSPYVWFLLSCGGQPETGVVRGKLENGVIRASIANPRTLAGRAGAPAAGSHCDLQVRATDLSGTDSNTATAAFDFK